MLWKLRNIEDHNNMEFKQEIGVEVNAAAIKNKEIQNDVTIQKECIKIKQMKPQNFVCKICGKDSKSSRDFLNHERIHTGEKPFKCTACGKSFPQKSNLKTHETMHSRKKPFNRMSTQETKSE